MKIQLPYTCRKCNKSYFIPLDINDNSCVTNCICGESSPLFLGNFFTRGMKIWLRSKYELEENEDPTISIILSAISFEAELSRVFIKVKFINSDDFVEDEYLEEDLRSIRSIKSKINTIIELVHEEGIEDFISKDNDMEDFIEKAYQKFPEFNLNEFDSFIEKNLFWPRNQILHLGKSYFSIDDARRCLDISSFAKSLLKRMEKSWSNKQ